MTGQRDIERTLDAWFVDGPTVMPDRLFDAVLDQVGHTRQHPLALLTLRLREMNPKIRWLTAAAAGLAAVVVALTLINRPTGPNVGATSSLPPSPTASDSAVPDGLIGAWQGETRTVPGVHEGAGTTLWFNAAQFYLTQANDSPSQLLRSDLRIAGDGVFELRTEVANASCQAGDAGRYSWTLSPSGRTLTIAEEAVDGCAVRGDAVVGTWWLMGCEDPSPDAACLGPLDAGAYASEYIDPFVGAGEQWQARFGALRYTVPAGWSNTADWPSEFVLAPAGGPETTNVSLVSDVVIASRADNCTEEQDLEAGTTAAAMVAALARPGVSVSTPEPVSIGGLPGFWVDLALKASWTTPCPWSEDRPYVLLFVDRPTDPGFAWGLDESSRFRAYFLDVEADRALLVAIQSASEAEQTAFVGEATPVVESFDFTP